MQTSIPSAISILLLTLASVATAQDLTKITGVDPALAVGSSRSVNWVDADGDGDLDAYVTSGGSLFENNESYRNDGTGFAAQPGSAIALDSLRADGSTWGDYDNDGDPDLFVVSWYGEVNALFENLGAGSFNRITTGPAVTTGTFSEGVAWVDHDADGDLDLQVINSGNGPTGRDNRFYRNDAGALIEITTGPLVTDGNQSRQGAWADYDADGDVDVLVVNEGGENNRLYRNRLMETGTADFEEVTSPPLTSDGGDSFSASWGDFDNDGDFDVMVANFSGTQNFLYRNQLTETGSPTFERLLDQEPGIHNGWSVGTHWADWDNDADLDLMVTNGFATLPNRRRKNFYYRNDAGNLVREQGTAAAADSGWSYGAAWGDSDADGDLDLLVANWFGTGQENFFYRNEAHANGNHWITLDCQGVTSNRSGIGCEIRATATIGGQSVTQLRQLAGSDGYCSQTLRAHFGLADATQIDTLEVRWPSGIEQTLTNVAADQHLEVVEPSGVDAPTLEPPSAGTARIEGIRPNPFRTATNIRYATAIRGSVRVDVVDASGRRLRRLIDENRPPGSYEVAWDGRDDAGARVASGVYFVELQVGGQRRAEKVLFVR